MKDSPKVSLLIVSYNQQEYIEEAILGALSQDYGNLEIVIADDCSLDSTYSIVSKYAQEYPGRIVCNQNARNLGITGNCNVGLSLCTGSLIAIQGGDDVMFDDKISLQVAVFNHDASVDVCYHDMRVFGKSICQSNEFLWSEKFVPREGYVDKLINYGNFFCGSSLMWRRNKDIPINFNTLVPISSDWLFCVEILATSFGKIKYLDAVCGKYRRHDSNITASSDHSFQESLISLNYIRDAYPHLSQLVYRRLGFVYALESIRGLVKLNLVSSVRLFIRALSFSSLQSILDVSSLSVKYILRRPL